MTKEDEDNLKAQGWRWEGPFYVRPLRWGVCELLWPYQVVDSTNPASSLARKVTP